MAVVHYNSFFNIKRKGFLCHLVVQVLILVPKKLLWIFFTRSDCWFTEEWVKSHAAIVNTRVFSCRSYKTIIRYQTYPKENLSY